MYGFGVVGKIKIKKYFVLVMKKIIMNKLFVDMGGFKEFLVKGCFDLYY